MGNHDVKKKNNTCLLTTQRQCDGGESKTRGSVVFENISFAYPSRSHHTILNHLNLEILPGTTMALVGVSGCGKSTIMGLLQRFYEPSSGRILMDGVELKSLNLKLYRYKIHSHCNFYRLSTSIQLKNCIFLVISFFVSTGWLYILFNSIKAKYWCSDTRSCIIFWIHFVESDIWMSKLCNNYGRCHPCC